MEALFGAGQDEDAGYRRWDRPEISLIVVIDQHHKVVDFSVYVKPGHVLCTPDGVCLGRDTYADLQRLAGAKQIKLSGEVVNGEGDNILSEHVGVAIPRLGQDVSYSWSANDEDLPDVPNLGGDYSVSLHPVLVQFFKNRPVMGYDDQLDKVADPVPLSKENDTGG